MPKHRATPTHRSLLGREQAKRVRAAVLNLECEQVVRSGSAEIDRGDRLARIGRGCPRNDSRNRSSATIQRLEHRVGGGNRRHGALHAFGSVVPAKNTLRLQQSTTRPAGRHVERLECDALEIGVLPALRPHRERQRTDSAVRVRRCKSSRDRPLPAPEAANGVDASVQIDDVLAAGRVMQAIDILRDELNDPPVLLPASPARGARRSGAPNRIRRKPARLLAQ